MFKIMNHQIEQLKDEIQQKDNALVKEHIEHQKARAKQFAEMNNTIRRDEQNNSPRCTCPSREGCVCVWPRRVHVTG